MLPDGDKMRWEKTKVLCGTMADEDELMMGGMGGSSVMSSDGRWLKVEVWVDSIIVIIGREGKGERGGEGRLPCHCSVCTTRVSCLFPFDIFVLSRSCLLRFLFYHDHVTLGSWFSWRR